MVIIVCLIPRVGGRMYTTEFGHHGDEIIELGANWIHGACATNSVFVLANEHRLLKNSVLLDRLVLCAYSMQISYELVYILSTSVKAYPVFKPEDIH